MSQLKTIKETAFELLMNLHPKHIKILNNQVLRPLYRMAEENEELKKAQAMAPIKDKKKDMKLVNSLKHENIDLIEKLKQTEDESIEIIKAHQAEMEKKDKEIKDLKSQLIISEGLVKSKQKIIDQFIKTKNKVTQ